MAGVDHVRPRIIPLRKQGDDVLRGILRVYDVYLAPAAEGGELLRAFERAGGRDIEAQALHAHGLHALAELAGHVVGEKAALTPGNKDARKLLDVFFRAALPGEVYEKKYVRAAYLQS